jgi:hypothetical protein
MSSAYDGWMRVAFIALAIFITFSLCADPLTIDCGSGSSSFLELGPMMMDEPEGAALFRARKTTEFRDFDPPYEELRISTLTIPGSTEDQLLFRIVGREDEPQYMTVQFPHSVQASRLSAISPSMPIFVWERETGPAGSTTREALLLDFTQPQPRSGGIACGPPAKADETSPAKSMKCSWDAALNDMVCTRRLESRVGMKRVSVRRSRLLAGEDLPVTARGYPWFPSPGAALNGLRKQPIMYFVVSGIGLLAMSKGSPDGSGFYVAEGGGELPELRFFEVYPSTGTFREVPVQSLRPESPPSSFTAPYRGFDIAADHQTPVPTVFMFETRGLGAYGAEVTYERDGQRAIYWVSSTDPQFWQPRVYQVAMSGEEWAGPGRALRPASASAINRKAYGGMFIAEVTIEPATLVDSEHGTTAADTECSARVSVVIMMGGEPEISTINPCVRARSLATLAPGWFVGKVALKPATKRAH